MHIFNHINYFSAMSQNININLVTQDSTTDFHWCFYFPMNFGNHCPKALSLTASLEGKISNKLSLKEKKGFSWKIISRYVYIHVFAHNILFIIVMLRLIGWRWPFRLWNMVNQVDDGNILLYLFKHHWLKVFWSRIWHHKVQHCKLEKYCTCTYYIVYIFYFDSDEEIR